MPRAFSSGFGAGFGGPHNHGTLILKVGTVGPDPAYQDGDIVTAINRRRVRQVHAERLCHPRAAARIAGGRIDAQSLSRRMFDEVYQYRMERVSPTAVVRYDLIGGGDPEVFTAPDIDVEQYVRRRLSAPQQIKIFGPEGSEFWYGGRLRLGALDLDRVWAKIEEHSPHREIDYGDLPLGTTEARTMLAIRVDDFDDAEAVQLVAPEVDDTVTDAPVLVRRRVQQIPWRSLPGMSASRIAQVEDRQVALDLRAERKHPRAAHLQRKV